MPIIQEEEAREYPTIALLGRQPKLGIAELESKFGPNNIKPFGGNACLLKLPYRDINLNHLGGIMRIGEVKDILPDAKWPKIEDYLLRSTTKHFAQNSSPTKLVFGLSVTGISTQPRTISKTVLRMKKEIKATLQRPVRIVPHTQLELNSATVIHNKLTDKNNWEMLLVSDGMTTYVARTTAIQDIEAYTRRDQARPFRDAKVGMLPPKLAQILINIAVGDHYAEPPGSVTILDPFCGTGVVLQESLLLDYTSIGTDLSSRMVEYSTKNIQWIKDTLATDANHSRVAKSHIYQADATKHAWDFSVIPHTSKVYVASETFLGHPLSALPASDQLRNIIHESNLINHTFLKNISSQIPKGTRLCIAIPAWRGKHEFLHLPMLDYLSDMGYNRTRFTHVNDSELVYHRPNQVVAREILTLVKS